MKECYIVVACTFDNGIGACGLIPWYIPEDIKFFRRLTSTANPGKINACIMGRITYESIGKPLANRINIVITSKKIPDVICVPDFPSAIAAASREDVESIFIIGGSSVYAEAIKYSNCTKIFMTQIQKNAEEFNCDRFLPDISNYEVLQTGILINDTLPYKLLVFTRTQ